MWNREFAPLDDVLKIVVHQKFAVAKHRAEQVLFSLLKLFLSDGAIIAIANNQGQPATLRSLLSIRLGLLVNILPLTVDLNSIRLLRECQCVAVDILEQAAAHAQIDIVCGDTATIEFGIDLLEGFDGKAVALCCSDVIRKDLVALRVGREAKLGKEALDSVGDNCGWVARIGAH